MNAIKEKTISKEQKKLLDEYLTNLKRLNKSPSLQKRHKNSKYSGLSSSMGQRENKEVLEKINVIYMEGEEKLK